jgi:transcriptional regulator with XRE-family HTH domain
MEVTKETVLKWLSDSRRSQTWLAQQCEVSKQAVSNWLRDKNNQPISAAAELKIRALMTEDAAAAQSAPPHNLVLEFTDKEYEPIEQAALANRETVRDWAKRLLNEAAGLNVDAFAQAVKVESVSMAADGPNPDATPDGPSVTYTGLKSLPGGKEGNSSRSSRA